MVVSKDGVEGYCGREVPIFQGQGRCEQWVSFMLNQLVIRGVRYRNTG